MELLKKNEKQASMELVQITGESKSRPGRMVIFELILAVALSVGCWFTFFSMFPNPVDKTVSVLLIIILPVILYMLCRNRFLSRFMVFYVFIITALIFVICYETVWNGFLVMANIVIEVLNNQMSAGLIPFELAGTSQEWGTDAMMMMIPVMLLSSMGIVYSIYHKEPLLGFVLTAIPVMIGLCLKAEPSVWLLVLLLLCWTGLLVLSAVARPDSYKKNRPIFIQNERNSSLPYIFIGITLVILSSYVLAFSGDDYVPPAGVDEAKDTVVTVSEHLRYDNLNGADKDQLSRGDLNESHPLTYTDTSVMELKMERPVSMYLRGFVGGTYDDGKWTESAEGAYSGEYTGITEWLAQENFYPWMQQDRLYRMSESYDYVTVEVENINTSSKYIYLPYEAAMSGQTMPDEVNYKKDYGAFAKGLRGQREYSFEAFLPRLTDYNEAEISGWLSELKKSGDWDDYAQTEAVYRRYVYDTYLYLSQDDYETLNETGIRKCEGRTIAYTLHYIRKLFDDQYTYDVEQNVAKGGRDELQHFVSDSKAGNDMHFATAATLMFRRAGIPARYAEGYYLSPKDMFLYTDMSEVSVSVTDSQAHCWVEIYIDEIGWLPVEIIPGFYDMEKQLTNEMQDDEKINEETKKNYEDEAPVYNDPEKTDEDDDKGISPIVWILLALIVAIVLFVIIGRRRISKKLAAFGNTYTDDQIYKMYHHVSRLMAFDKNQIPANPYDKVTEISEKYNKATEISFEEFLRIVNAVRFGGISASVEEHKKMAGYVMNIADHIYTSQNRWKKFLMKFICFYL